MNARVPAEQRRDMLVGAGIEIARAEGGRAVTLARVAEACGVSKPIAYRLFDSLADLLVQMERRVVDGYVRVVTEALTDAVKVGAGRAERLAVLVESYVDHSLGEGAVFDAVSGARAAAEGTKEHLFELPDPLVDLGAGVFGLAREQAVPLVIMFQGAVDYLVVGVEAGAVSREAAIAHVIDLFTPQLAEGPAS